MRKLHAYSKTLANTKEAAIVDGSDFLIGQFEDDADKASMARAAASTADSFGETLMFFTTDDDHERYNGRDLHPEVLQGIQDEGYFVWEHDRYDGEDWRKDVLNSKCLQSYHQWVSEQIRREENTVEVVEP
jgi:hypothetical protein